jgi:hypothetical protein
LQQAAARNAVLEIVHYFLPLRSVRVAPRMSLCLQFLIVVTCCAAVRRNDPPPSRRRCLTETNRTYTPKRRVVPATINAAFAG